MYTFCVVTRCISFICPRASFPCVLLICGLMSAKTQISATRKRRTQPHSSREGYEARKMPILQRAFLLAVLLYHRKRKLTPPVIDKCVVYHHYRAWICGNAEMQASKKRMCNTVECFSRRQCACGSLVKGSTRKLPCMESCACSPRSGCHDHT